VRNFTIALSIRAHERERKRGGSLRRQSPFIYLAGKGGERGLSLLQRRVKTRLYYRILSAEDASREEKRSSSVLKERGGGEGENVIAPDVAFQFLERKKEKRSFSSLLI